MSYHLGEEFEGIISGVTGWGLRRGTSEYRRGTVVQVNTLVMTTMFFDQESYELADDKESVQAGRCLVSAWQR